MTIDKRTASAWMDAFVDMWTSVSDDRRRYRDTIEDAIKRLDAGAPAWEVASRLRTALGGIDPDGEAS